MSVTLHELAELVQGQALGDPDLIVKAARPVGAAEEGDITFVETDQHAHLLHGCRASAAVVPSSFPGNGLALIRVTDPLSAFVTIVRHLHGQAEAPRHGIDARAFVDLSATIGEDASIYPFANIGAESSVGARCRIHGGAVVGRLCRLGDDVVLYPNVVLYDGTILGNRVTVHANAVIGADGFGYRLQNGRHVKVPQLGHVEIGDDVEIGACTTIDRGTFQATKIGEGTKIDNLVQIGHNCRIGRHNLFVSQIGIAGSSSTGDYVVIAGQAGIVDHVHIGDRAIIGAKAGVTKDVPAGLRMLGAPATPEREQKRVLMTLERLPEIRRDVQKIKQRLEITDE
ncbi:MAG TPA: UDP-3-O-(3-hydroxymyristoyl)glucosamine N-acyltransferase [Gemmataceae bacterium]|nr:UDP-3-O-(3-hydroxymyristoyl)glucosamine N-acyltransferase [Gemmataceae bacterium]